MSNPFGTIPDEAILEGTATDAYFDRTRSTLEYAGKNPHVVAEVTADQFPTGSFDVFTGVRDVATLFEGRAVDVDALPDGHLFDGGPVMRIEGPYLEFAELETSLLGFLSQPSGFATAALESRLAAPESTVLSFGARHVHPSIAATVERAALLAGLDGFSHVAAGEILDREAGGTMPHALMFCFGEGNQAEAWETYDEAVAADVPRIALVDTFWDEKSESLLAAETLGDDLDGVRIDTTGSRRGDFRHIIREVRWELDARGYEDVDIFCSGGIGPDSMRELRDVADGFGVGSHITSADSVDFSLDIVEIEGEPISKRGKLSGVKQVYRTAAGGHHVVLADREAPADATALLEPLVRDGELVREFDLDEASERCLADAEAVSFGDQNI
ncbi:nicotinate phosphoribosyltransferase [Natrialba magadii ATCC 43099]|uniref:nicotinate phosphoribosyltransferase n=1 Tax=Natrialba magadii (strain ATCC 43099 / DSM 3394 / CCM 3739 / CIP 104546 / IAM 13178 / JCM 8861 / NBRC 102185 / NCIMB 2190 / MS3) TaxID=547559 RepID=D3SWN6_NATMM|nr:nicotinate phosphoribosyltransferase [Natrialba magadii]ADD05768.1 nicotinate phosphoribosyltransferase [Natrialba magadii ATCC 43099]ELY30157.1 nicotinate phosphoribosyltransferase [Natrialba magadii ATCC 43099]